MCEMCLRPVCITRAFGKHVGLSGWASDWGNARTHTYRSSRAVLKRGTYCFFSSAVFCPGRGGVRDWGGAKAHRKERPQDADVGGEGRTRMDALSFQKLVQALRAVEGEKLATQTRRGKNGG